MPEQPEKEKPEKEKPEKEKPDKEKPEPKKPEAAKKKTEKEAKEAKETNVKLTANSIVSSERGCDYLVERMLGQGGFGEVWKVSELDDPDKRYAMKIEPNFHEKKHMLRLKCEVNVFEAIANSDPKRFDRTHFLKMHDRGKTTAFKYYVMDLIWLSLREVKKKICGNVFTPSTTIKVARQTLKSIETLHELGFLHRDIKPHNYAVGLPPKDDILYLIDFGIARFYREKDGKIRVARKTVNFMGTLMYASMESLARNEQARRDDLEMWLWMMLEIYDPNNLTWGKLDTEDLFAYIEARQELMLNSRDLRREGKLRMPELWCSIMDMINDLDFETTPDYDGINHFLSVMCLDLGINESLPFDWAGKAPNLSDRPPRKDRLERKKKKAEEAAAKKAKEEEEAAKKKSKEEVKEEDGKEGAAAAAAAKKPSKEEVKASKEEVKEDEGKVPKARAKPTKKQTTEDRDEKVPEREGSEKSSYSAYIRWKKRVRDKKKEEKTDKGKVKGSKASVASKASKQEAKKSRKEDEVKDGGAVAKIPEVKPKEMKKEVAVEKKPAEVVPTIKKEIVPDKPKEVKKDKAAPAVKAPEVKVAAKPTKFKPPKKKKKNNSKTEISPSCSHTSDREVVAKTRNKTRATTEETVENDNKYGKRKAALSKEVTEKEKKNVPTKTTKDVEEVKKIPDEKPAEKPAAAVKKGVDKK